MAHDPAAIWHKVAFSNDIAALSAIIHEDCVFESPVVHSPQRGKAITVKYLAGAMLVLNNEAFEYVGEWHAPNSAVLEFTSELDGVKINGVDIISCDDDGLITHFKVMVRPLQAVNMLHQKMGEMLTQMAK